MTTSARRSKELFTSLPGIQAVHAELLKRHRAVGDAPDVLAEIEDFMKRAAAAGSLLDADSDRWAVQSLLDYWATTLHRATDVLPDATLADFDPALAPTLDDSLCPYLGLDAFKADQKDRYFGRQQLVEHLVERLEKARLVALIGPSGSGKSSLILAGVLPALQSGAISGSDQWNYLPPIIPGADPLESMARMVLPRNTEQARVDAVAQEFKGDADHLATVLGRQTEPAVIVVDQFEEILTLCRDDADRQAFVENLLAVARTAGPRHTVILTMRDDFMGQVSRLPALAGQFDKVLTVVVPPTAAELKDAIEKPAAQIGLKFEEGLVDQLLKDVVNEPAGLPLLQFTLLKLWEARDHNRITRRAYERLGGGRECLARSADEVWVALGLPENQEAGKRILLELVRPEGRDFTSKRVRRERLYKIGIPANRITTALDRLVAARLLRVTPGETEADDRIEVAHEALVRNWPKLSAWLEEERERMRHRIALTSKAEEWENRGRDRYLLLRGEVLHEAVKYEELGEVESAYVAASVAEDERARRIRQWRARGLVAAVILILIASIVMTVKFRALAAQATAQRIRADSNAARALVLRDSANALAGERLSAMEDARASADEAARQAAAQVVATRSATQQLSAANASYAADDRPEKGILLALYAMSFGQSPNSNRALEKAVLAWGLPTTLRTPQPGEILSTAVSPDSLWLAAATDNSIQLWNLRSQTKARTLIGHTDVIRDLVFDAAGSHLISGGDDSTIRVWDLASGKELDSWNAHQGMVLSLAFSRTKNLLASAGINGETRIWDRSHRLVQVLTGHKSAVWDLAFNPLGTRLISVGQDHRGLIYATDSTWPLIDSLGKDTTEQRHQAGIVDVTYSPNGRFIATASTDSTARVWAAAGGNQSVSINTTFPVWDVAFTPDNTKLVTGSSQGDIQVWDWATNNQVRTLRGHNSNVYSMNFIDRSHLVSADKEGRVLLWDISGEQETQSMKPASAFYSVAISLDGKWVAAGSGSGQIWIGERDYRPGVSDSLRATGSFKAAPSNTTVRSVAFGPGGTTLASVSSDSLKLWNLATRTPIWSWGAAAAQQGGPKNSSTRPVANLQLWSVAISADGKYVAVGGLDSTLRLFDGRTGAKLQEVRMDSGQVAAVTFHPRRPDLLVSAGQDRKVRLWDAASMTQLQVLSGHTNTILRVAFDSAGTTLVSTGIDGAARVYQLEGSRLTETLSIEAHRSWVWGGSFSRDGRFLATAANDSTVRVWDLTSGTRVRNIVLPATSSQGIEFGPRNNLIVAGVNGTIRLYPVSQSDPRGLMAMARIRLERSLSPLECRTELDRSCPETVELHLANARAEARKGNRQAAYAEFRRAETLDPDLGIDADKLLRPLLASAAVDRATDDAVHGRVSEATASFRTAKSLDPTLEFDPAAEAQRVAEAQAVIEMRSRVQQNDLAGAMAAMERVRQLNPALLRRSSMAGLYSQISDTLARAGRMNEAIDLMQLALASDSITPTNNQLNSVCWFGAVRRFADRVIGFCDRAVAIDSSITNIRDSRGVARALTGDVAGAIADFEAYAADKRNSTDSRNRRRAWAEALKRPTPVSEVFTDQVLTGLLSE